MKDKDGYFTLDHREQEKLGEVSGEAMRLYIAMASHAYGPKVICRAGWGALATRMGKPIVVDKNKVYGKKSHPDKRGEPVPAQEQRKNQKKRIILLARELERAGLIAQKMEVGDDGKERRAGKGIDRFRLVFKEQMLKHDAKGEGIPEIPPTDDGDPPEGKPTNPRGETSNPQRGNPSPPHNNKLNSKEEEENSNNNSLEIEEEQIEDLLNEEKIEEELQGHSEFENALMDAINNPPETQVSEESKAFIQFTQQIESKLQGPLHTYKETLITQSFKDFTEEDWDTLRTKFHHNYYDDEQIDLMKRIIYSNGFPDVLDESIPNSFSWTSD